MSQAVPRTVELFMEHETPELLHRSLYEELKSKFHFAALAIVATTEPLTLRANRAPEVVIYRTQLEVRYLADTARVDVASAVDQWLIANEIGTVAVKVSRHESARPEPMSSARRAELEGSLFDQKSAYADARAFRQERAVLEALKQAHHANADVFTHMQKTAQAAAGYANAHSKTLAKRFNRRPVTITASSLLRN